MSVSTVHDVAVGADNIAETLTAAVGEAFELASAQRSRPPHHLGLSGLGRCRRQAAYALAGTPVSDTAPPQQGRAANLGTWEHEGLLPLLASVLDGEPVVERAVTLRAGSRRIPGHIDLHWGNVIIDLKTVGEHRLGRADAGPFTDHLLQVAGYALAARQAGLPAEWVAWIYMDRATGNDRIHVQRFTTALGLRVVERVAELERYAAAPDTAPRDERGPGLSWACDECPWLRACWGPTAVPGQVGAQGDLLGREDAAVAAALDLYAAAREQARQAKERQEFCRAVFTGARPGTYGRWRWYQARDSVELDGAAAAALLRERGVEPPLRVKAGALQVRPA